MLRKLVILLVCAVLAASVPFLYERNPELFEGMILSALGKNEQEPPHTIAMAEIRPARAMDSGPETLLGRKVRIDSDATGHFNADFKINGRNVKGMVDTGATLVALNFSTATRAGIKVTPADFKYLVMTANGETRAAGVLIRELQIGRITVENVEALVLDDKSLRDTLIGVSFLKRLARYHVENGELLLVQ